MSRLAPPFYYGGQALIEGVMIRGQRHLAVALRRPDGKLFLEVKPLSNFYTGRLRRIPLLRGIVVLVEALVLGTTALLHSAQVYAGEEDEKGSPWVMGPSLLLGVGLAVVLFVVLPSLATGFLPGAFPTLAVHGVEGVVRLGLFVGYLWLIGRWGEISRVFAYHGAEHKAVNAYEAGLPLEVDRLQGASAAHRRCGTSFVFFVLVIAVFVFAFLGRPPIWWGVPARLLLLPFIAALSYEVIRFGAGHFQRGLGRWLMAPALALQALTTREPDRGQLEVAIAALEGAIEADGQAQADSATS